MQKFQTLSALAAPLRRSNVDTDQIIPAQFLTSVSKLGYGENLFRIVREGDPTFFLNDEKYADAEILISDENFGSGSSREHAVWAIQGAGYKAVIAKSFADIFSSNSAKNGLLLIVLPTEVVDEFLAKAESSELRLRLDLESQTVTDGEQQYQFEYDSFRKHCLLEGLDDIDYILSHKAEVESFKKDQEGNRYFSTSKAVDG